MKVGFLLPSILTSEKQLKDRIFAPLYPALDLVNKLVEKGHTVNFYTSSDVASKTSAKVIGGDPTLSDNDPFYYQFRNRNPQEQKYAGTEIRKRDFEYDLILKAYKDALLGKLDVIHSYHDFGAHYFNELTGFPTVYTLHDPVPKQEGTIEYHRFSKFKHHNYVSISNHQREGILDLNFVANIYHGIDLDKFQFSSKSSDMLIHFGRLIEDKGADIALSVAKELDMRLEIATSKSKANTSDKYVENKIAPLLDGKKREIYGYVKGKDRSQFIGRGKAFLLPLRWEEPFGLTIVESMACGTPVIAYARGSAQELIIDGKTGFLVRPDETFPGDFIIKKTGLEGLKEAVKRTDEIDRKDCRRHVEENFTVEKMTANYEEVYRKVLAK